MDLYLCQVTSPTLDMSLCQMVVLGNDFADLHRGARLVCYNHECA